MKHEHKELLEHFLFFMVLIVLFVSIAMGADAEWVMKGDTIKLDVGGTIHELTLIDVSENDCAFLINGNLKAFGKYSKHNVDGLLVHIVDIEELPHTGLCKIDLPGKVVKEVVEEVDLQNDEFTDLAVQELSEQKMEPLIEAPVEKEPVKEAPVYIKEGVKVSLWQKIVAWFRAVF